MYHREDDEEKNPMFKVMRQYMCMVMEMLTFIIVGRPGDWKLHLKALDLFTKNIFCSQSFELCSHDPTVSLRDDITGNIGNLC